jgi:hypothetical protein
MPTEEPITPEERKEAALKVAGLLGYRGQQQLHYAELWSSGGAGERVTWEIEMAVYLTRAEAQRDAAEKKLAEVVAHQEAEARYIDDLVPRIDDPMTEDGIKDAMEYAETCKCGRCEHARHVLKVLHRAQAAEALCDSLAEALRDCITYRYDKTPDEADEALAAYDRSRKGKTK